MPPLPNIDVRTDRSGITTIAITRPEVRNALTVDAMRELRTAFSTAIDAGDTRAVVLHGSEGSFCAGADLSLVRSALDGDAPSVLGPMVTELHDAIRVIRSAPFPVVAAIEGFAVGAGMGLALAADARVTDVDARLVPGYFGIGASPDGGVSYFLARALGAARATALILRNQPLDADTMASFGLVEEVVAPGQAIEAASALAQQVAGAPPLALVRLRRLVDDATAQSLTAHLDAERDAVAELWATHDFQEGVSAFLERRSPTFLGE